MSNRGSVWAIVLAAGDGKRLERVTRNGDGHPVPKQYFRFDGRRSLLSRTLDRARRLVPAERVVVVVARRHRRWWNDELRSIPPGNVVVQPENRGTAAGILLPLLHVLARDPDAAVVILPSNHHVEDEAILESSLHAALRAARTRPERLVLLGMTPDRAELGYGWILPNPGSGGGARGVSAFFEKPDGALATLLLARGALWSSFLMASTGRALVDLFRRTAPALWSRLAPVAGRAPSARLEAVYRELETLDFSQQVLQAAPQRLRLLAVPACGWTDLGTPERVAEWLGRSPAAVPATWSRTTGLARPRLPAPAPIPVPAAPA